MNRISQADLLNAVFCNVYETEFHADNLDDRVMLQKAVFLMREKGISCGHYEFVWDHYGPFSAELSDDMKLEVETSSPAVEFDYDAEEIMTSLKEIFKLKTSYSMRHWVETLASLLYLKNYMYPSYTDEQIIQVLENKKSDLSDHAENIKAMRVIQDTFVA